ncbi:MAG: minor capsid protein [Synergistaceae bacterium]
MTLVEAIRQVVIDKGINAVYIVDAPVAGECVLITPYMAETHEGAEASENKFQLYCASDTFVTSESLAWKVFRSLEGAIPPKCDRQILGSVYALQEPFFLDKDAKNRYIHCFNIAVNAVWKGE